MFHNVIYNFIIWNSLFLNYYISNNHLSNLCIILYILCIILYIAPSSSFTLQIYLYQQINTISYHLYHNTPQKTSCPCPTIQLAKMYKKQLALISCHNTLLLRYVLPSRVYLHFQKRQSFPQGRDVFHSNVDHQIQITDSTPIP